MNAPLPRLLAKLPSFMLPFASRTLRGDRGVKVQLVSLVVALATLLLGLWIGLSEQRAAQGLRVTMGVEQDEWTRQTEEFVVFAHDPLERSKLEDEVAEIRVTGPFNPAADFRGSVWRVATEDRALVRRAATGAAPPAEYAELYQRSREAVGQRAPDPDAWEFEWAEHAERIERVLALGGVPEIRRYESPLNLRESLRVIGTLAGVVLFGCLTVLLPLFVGLQQAQEQHENTLMPLTGTGMSARELVLGLAAGPGCAIGLIAAPQLLLFGLCAVVIGDLWSGLATLFVLAATTCVFTIVAQLIGHWYGPRRSSGVIAAGLIATSMSTWIAGIGAAGQLRGRMVSTPTVLPNMGLVVALRRTFQPWSSELETAATYAAVLGSVGALVLAGLVFVVLIRRIEGRAVLLDGKAGLLGAVTCIALVHAASPYWTSPTNIRGLVLLLPFALLLMARIPVGDRPPSMTAVPVPRLLAEFGGWIALAVATSVILGLDRLQLDASLWFTWSAVSLGLLAIDQRALPTTVRSQLFVSVCGLAAIIGLVRAAASTQPDPSLWTRPLALLSKAPVMGIVQIAVLIVVPLVLVRNLRKRLGSITGEASTPANSR